MEIFLILYTPVWYSFVFWVNFQSSLQAIQIQGYLNCYVWVVLDYFWSCRVDCFFHIYKKNQSISLYHSSSYNSIHNFSHFEHNSPQYLTIFSWYYYSCCVYGFQLYASRPYKLWFRMWISFSGWLSTSHRHPKRWSNDIDIYNDIIVELDCRIWWKKSIFNNINFLHCFNDFG